MLLLAASGPMGARIYDRTVVEKYEPGVDAVRLQTNRGGKVIAKHAVFATGYESQEFLPRGIVKLKSTYALATEPLTEFPWLVGAMPDLGNFAAVYVFTNNR